MSQSLGNFRMLVDDNWETLQLDLEIAVLIDVIQAPLKAVFSGDIARISSIANNNDCVEIPSIEFRSVPNK